MYVLCKEHHSFLAFRNLTQHFSSTLGPNETEKTPTKIQKEPNKPLNKQWKGHRFTVQELKQEGRVCQETQCLLLRTCLQKCHKYWFGGYKYILARRWNCKYRIYNRGSTIVPSLSSRCQVLSASSVSLWRPKQKTRVLEEPPCWRRN